MNQAPGYQSISALTRMKIIESEFLVTDEVMAEDWTRVRSPGRAARRRRQGKRQNIRLIFRPQPDLFVANDTIYGHPETIRLLLKKIADQQREKMHLFEERIFFGGQRPR